jgi:hypothetical protein
MILMKEHDYERCAHISQKKFKTTNKTIKEKAISQQFINHTQRIVE